MLGPPVVCLGVSFTRLPYHPMFFHLFVVCGIAPSNGFSILAILSPYVNAKVYPYFEVSF
jgi:hypothetical protein